MLHYFGVILHALVLHLTTALIVWFFITPFSIQYYIVREIFKVFVVF
jgi:hypothetical protein